MHVEVMREMAKMVAQVVTHNYKKHTREVVWYWPQLVQVVAAVLVVAAVARALVAVEGRVEIRAEVQVRTGKIWELFMCWEQFVLMFRLGCQA